MRKATLLIALLFFGCSKKKDSNVASSDVIGSWKWVFQAGSAPNWGGPTFGDTLTPENTGIQETLTFNPYGNYSVVENGRRVKFGSFKFETIIVPGAPNLGGPMTQLAFVVPGQPDSLVNHLVSHDSLYIMPMLVTTGVTVRIYVRSGGVENPN